MKPTVLVCIPTVRGREEFLERSLEGYRLRTPEADVRVSIVHDAPTCGIGWNRCVEQALSARAATPDYIHFSNDDIVVGEGWLPPLIEAVEAVAVPAPRLEPAGYHLGEEHPTSMPPPDNPPLSEVSYFYADLAENQPRRDWEVIDHGALPFCSWHQWKEIGPFIPIHFGTDKWFYRQARRMGFSVVARMDSVIYNYCAAIGRNKGEWSEIDVLDFDCVFAYPMYASGELSPYELPPDRLTPEGLRRVRRWREESFPGPHHWET